MPSVNLEDFMSVLSNLKLEKSDDRTQGYDPVRVRRKKLAAALQDQLHLLEASQAGGSYSKMKIKRTRDLESDELVEIEQRRKVTPWWWVDDNGVVKLSIRYGSARLILKDEKDCLVVSSLAHLQKLLPALRQEVLAGGLDGPLAIAADALQARFRSEEVTASMKGKKCQAGNPA